MRVGMVLSRGSYPQLAGSSPTPATNHCPARRRRSLRAAQVSFPVSPAGGVLYLSPGRPRRPQNGQTPQTGYPHTPRPPEAILGPYTAFQANHTERPPASDQVVLLLRPRENPADPHQAPAATSPPARLPAPGYFRPGLNWPGPGSEFPMNGPAHRTDTRCPMAMATEGERRCGPTKVGKLQPRLEQ